MQKKKKKGYIMRPLCASQVSNSIVVLEDMLFFFFYWVDKIRALYYIILYCIIRFCYIRVGVLDIYITIC